MRTHAHAHTHKDTHCVDGKLRPLGFSVRNEVLPLCQVFVDFCTVREREVEIGHSQEEEFNFAA